MLQPTTTNEKRHRRGGPGNARHFTAEELGFIDRSLEAGHMIPTICEHLDVAERTFYYLLEKAGKEIETTTLRRLRDIPNPASGKEAESNLPPQPTGGP